MLWRIFVPTNHKKLIGHNKINNMLRAKITNGQRDIPPNRQTYTMITKEHTVKSYNKTRQGGISFSKFCLSLVFVFALHGMYWSKNLFKFFHYQHVYSVLKNYSYLGVHIADQLVLPVTRNCSHILMQFKIRSLIL